MIWHEGPAQPGFEPSTTHSREQLCYQLSQRGCRRLIQCEITKTYSMVRRKQHMWLLQQRPLLKQILALALKLSLTNKCVIKNGDQLAIIMRKSQWMNLVIFFSRFPIHWHIWKANLCLGKQTHISHRRSGNEKTLIFVQTQEKESKKKKVWGVSNVHCLQFLKYTLKILYSQKLCVLNGSTPEKSFHF